MKKFHIPRLLEKRKGTPSAGVKLFENLREWILGEVLCLNWIQKYNKALTSGKIAASKRLKRIYSTLAADSVKPKGGYHFDEASAQRPIDFIETFCLNSKGIWAGKNIQLELFQKAFISALFGFIDRQGRRRFREAFFYVARKNGKSTLLAALALYCLLADGEDGAEIYSIATKKDQAKLVFEEAVNMVRQSPALSAYIKKRKSDLYVKDTFSKFQPLGKNADTLDGLNAHLVILDEAHGVKGRDIYEVLKQSQSARSNPLFITITTAGTLRESIFDDLYEYAKGVADGTIDDKRFLPILYELDNRAEWKEPANWIKSNPALGTIKRLDDLQDKVQRAAQSPQELNGLLTKDFNVICNTSSAWLSFEDIDNKATFDLAQFKGAYAIGGVDLSICRDLTCASLLMLDAAENRYVTQMYWLPEEGINQRVQIEKIPYDKWQEQGYLRLCKGNTVDYHCVTEWFLEMLNDYEITPLVVAFDPYSAGYWGQEMTAAGFRLKKIYQQPKYLSPAMQMLGADLQSKRVVYNSNPILKWCMTNTGVEETKDGIIPKKANRQIDKIDGVASLLTAYAALHIHYAEFSKLAKE